MSIRYAILRNIFNFSKLGNRIIKGQADSGLNIDHIYRGKAKGRTAFGRFIDQILLNLPSVKATRLKKEILIKILSNEIANNLIQNKKTKILDLASGPSRYMVDLVKDSNQDKIEVLCIDNDRRSINFGKLISSGKPIRYARANIFHLEPLKRLSERLRWRPNVVMVTGFFEMQEDEVVNSILKDIHHHLEQDGLVIFTSQLDNPSKKIMVKIGKTQNNSPWKMYFRKPEQLRKWLFNIGFRDVIVSVDKFGIYEYCTGRKI